MQPSTPPPRLPNVSEQNSRSIFESCLKGRRKSPVSKATLASFHATGFPARFPHHSMWPAGIPGLLAGLFFMGGHSKGAVHREELPQTDLKPQLVVAGRRL